jgi:hypothetical protein
MDSSEEARALKMAMNESAFRTANERLRNAALGHRFLPDQRVPFVCECADDGCYEVVMLRLADYEQVRLHPSRCLLVAGHEDAEALHERVIEAEAGYAVVEKVGTAGREAAGSTGVVLVRPPLNSSVAWRPFRARRPRRARRLSAAAASELAAQQFDKAGALSLGERDDGLGRADVGEVK